MSAKLFFFFLQLAWNSVMCQYLIILSSGISLLIYFLLGQNSLQQCPPNGSLPEVIIPRCPYSTDNSTHGDDSQRLTEPPGPPVARFPRCQPQQNSLLLCPFPFHSGQLQLMSLKLWGARKTSRGISCWWCADSEQAHPWGVGFGIPSDQFSFFFFVLMKTLLASSTANSHWGRPY